MSMFSSIRWWALGGFLVPLLFYLDAGIRLAAHEVSGIGTLILILWPSSILTVAIQQDFDLFAAFVVGLSIALNVVVYSAVGIIWWVLRGFVHKRGQPPALN
jgi:hypothetical protein